MGFINHGGAATSSPSLVEIGGSGMRIFPPGLVTTTTNGYGSNVERVTPFVVAKATAYDRIGAEITSAAGSGTVRLGIRASLATGLPGALLLDAGGIDGTSATFQEITIVQTLQPGVYWFAILPLLTTQTLRASASGLWLPSVSNTTTTATRGYQQAGSGSSFSANFAMGTDLTTAPVVSLRLA